MKAFTYHRYGGPDVLEPAELPIPVPKEDEVLICVHATTVTSGDWRARTLAMPKGFGPMGRLAFGWEGPRQPILGTELAGTVAAVGEKVTRFRPGDAVIGFPGATFGAHAEYRAMKETAPIALKPAKLSFEEAASLSFGGSTALHFLRKAAIKPGETMLVIGASGAVGTALVQIGRHRGAVVTGVTSTANLGLVRSLGAATVIDYTAEDFAKRGETYDVIADTTGGLTFATARPLLRDKGRFLGIAGGLGEMLAPLWAPLAGSKRAIVGPAPERAADIEELAALVESDALRPVIDRIYEFAELPAAHAYVETRRKRGSVVVRVRE